MATSYGTMRKYNTSPEIMSPEGIVSPIERHKSNTSAEIRTTGTDGLGIAEKIMVLLINKNNKDTERMLFWAVLCELILAERISTCKQDDGSFGLYVYNKKLTGKPVLDDVLQTIIRLPSKSISNVMREVETTLGRGKIQSRIGSTLEQKGIIRMKKGGLFTSASFEPLNVQIELQIKEDIIIALEQASRRPSDIAEYIDPLTYALVSLLACNGVTLTKDVLESQDILMKQTALEMIPEHKMLHKGDIVRGMIFERLYHVIVEHQKK
jgi:hypothetical protein